MNINTESILYRNYNSVLTKTEHHPPPLWAHQLIIVGITQLHLASVKFQMQSKYQGESFPKLMSVSF